VFLQPFRLGKQGQFQPQFHAINETIPLLSISAGAVRRNMDRFAMKRAEEQKTNSRAKQ
jgi:hypothetical protein